MVNLKDPNALQLEFDQVAKDFTGLHDDMNFYLDAYQNNVFYPDKPNAPKRKKIGVNFLQIFADKLWYYLAPMPRISVPAIPEDRQNASIREKIIIGTHQYNEADVMWTRQTFDSVMMSCLATFLDYDFKENCVHEHRVDPRRLVWQKADGMSDKFETIWYFEPVTRKEFKRRYGKEPTGESMTMDMLADYNVTPNDGADYFMVITRTDDNTVTKFGGKQLLMKPYNHLLGRAPISITFPLEIASFNKRGDFYLRRLLDLQAEFNEYWRQRANIVRKLGNPTVWGRGIKQKQFQPVKDSMALDGGFVGLSDNGELGLLTVPETKMIDAALVECFQRMKDLAGFPTATFGESVGANTSGDALGMYFQPTSRMIDTMNSAMRNHWQNVNAMILKMYDTYLPIDEVKQLHAQVPGGQYIQNESGQMTRQYGSNSVSFGKQNIGANYFNVVTMTPPAPKDELAYKKLVLDAATQGKISNATFLDEWDILSPEDEMALIEEEKANPILNPEGTAQIMQGATAASQLNPNAQTPAQLTSGA